MALRHQAMLTMHTGAGSNGTKWLKLARACLIAGGLLLLLGVVMAASVSVPVIECRFPTTCTAE